MSGISINESFLEYIFSRILLFESSLLREYIYFILLFYFIVFKTFIEISDLIFYLFFSYLGKQD
jgi:hypothetical protein